jgi:predicted nucleic acid-binding protein
VRVLLDTCVLSELRRPLGAAGVRRTIQALDDADLFVSVISIGEISRGIGLLKEGGKKRELQAWLQALERHYSDRLLQVGLETCRLWGELSAAAQKLGRVVHAADGLIAATARQHGLYLMTRNASDFEPTGALLIDPWAG